MVGGSGNFISKIFLFTQRPLFTMYSNFQGIFLPIFPKRVCATTQFCSVFEKEKNLTKI